MQEFSLEWLEEFQEDNFLANNERDFLANEGQIVYFMCER